MLKYHHINYILRVEVMHLHNLYSVNIENHGNVNIYIGKSISSGK